MKTRKVGKIVSLLVAIVLVATIMIPAASVLAAQDGYDATSGVNWDGNNVKVVSVAKDEKNPGEAAYYQLRDYLRSAEPNKPIYIRIDADVDLPNFDSYDSYRTIDGKEFSKKHLQKANTILKLLMAFIRIRIKKNRRRAIGVKVLQLNMI